MTDARPGLCVIVGAGAQGRVTLEAWRSAVPTATFVFVDDNAALHGTEILGARVEGGLALLPSLVERDAVVVLAIGNPIARAALGARLGATVSRWGSAVAATATVMPSARLGGGSVVFAGAVVNSGADIGRHVIVNTGVIVEHDCIIGDAANLSPGVRMGGRVEVGAGAFVSVGATLAPRIRIGAGSIIGAGSVVVRDIPPNVVAYGVPARVTKTIDSSFDWKRLL